MIAHVAGTLAERQADHVVVDVGGVGYRLFVSTPTLARLPPEGEQVRLKVHTLVREDAFLLYGFSGEAERELFRTLIGLSKIGPKAAMQILSGLEAAELARCILEEDIGRLTKLPGVGRKTAERLVVELKDRIGGLVEAAPAAAGTSRPVGSSGRAVDDAIAALEGLGVPRARAARALEDVARDLAADAPAEQWVRAALRVLKPG